MPNEWDLFKSNTVNSNLDVELLKKEVGQRFPYYDIRIDTNAVAFFCRVDKDSLEQNFDSLRKSLSDKGYIPMLRAEHGEHIIYIITKPKGKQKSVWINIILLIATIITTILTGALLNSGYADMQSVPDLTEVLTLENLLNGAIYFSFPLLSILLIHEMGHYFTSRRYKLSVTLPYFMPIPPIVPGFNIGTFGALISSGDPMPNKKALFDVGISGPIAGFIVAIPVAIIGIATSEVVVIPPPVSGEVILGSSLLFTLISNLFHTVPEGFALNLNSIAFAGWVGLLITSINLLPAGQLDGGHIFRAVLGKHQRIAGWIAVMIMILTGWWFFALIIIFLMGMMHPPPLDDNSRLGFKRQILFIVALVVLILCYIPFPIATIQGV
ncbi:MAG: site-2 protease family protein [Candidatus Thermoplasmatota archaeon]|nr:site-2 protease family protein [Candidatus Thermoplasmatota archaeon]